ncbi:hypothetical protein [Vibrio neptunius]|nr:hypothetical protein [Vibrio neptunius]
MRAIKANPKWDEANKALDWSMLARAEHRYDERLKAAFATFSA